MLLCCIPWLAHLLGAELEGRHQRRQAAWLVLCSERGSGTSF